VRSLTYVLCNAMSRPQSIVKVLLIFSLCMMSFSQYNKVFFICNYIHLETGVFFQSLNEFFNDRKN